MKFLSFLLLLFLLTACGEEPQKPVEKTVVKKDTPMPVAPQRAPNPYAPVDVSPVDVSYFPPDYPVAKMSETANALPVARLIYSRPHRQGRKIFGGLVKYGEPWRLGANEATEIEFFQPVNIQNKRVAKGRYVLYCVPQPDRWTIVFNSNVYSWGLKFDPEKDVYRFQIPVQKTGNPIEFFTAVFEKTSSGADLILAWEDAVARLPIAI